MKKILVAYGSKKGSTREIAARIAKIISKRGYEVEMYPAERVKKLQDYSGVVLGCSVYMGQWNKAFVKFLKENESRLTQLPVWLFSSGPTGDQNPNEMAKEFFYPNKLEDLVKRIDPEDMVCFRGRLLNKHMNFLEKWIIKSVKAPVGDFRNWNRIESWAKKISPE